MAQEGGTFSLDETLEFFRFLEEDPRPRAGIPLSISQPPAFCTWDEVRKYHQTGSCGLPYMAGMLADGTFAMCGIAEHCEDAIYGNAAETPLEELWESAPSVLAHRESLKGGVREDIQAFLDEMCKAGCMTGPAPNETGKGDRAAATQARGFAAARPPVDCAQ